MLAIIDLTAGFLAFLLVFSIVLIVFTVIVAPRYLLVRKTGDEKFWFLLSVTAPIACFLVFLLMRFLGTFA